MCHLDRGEDGFGFVLCCENETTDTFVLQVIEDSAAAIAGLKPGDRMVEINEVNVETECHNNVVKLLQGLKSIRLVVRYNADANLYFARPDNGMTLHPLSSNRAPLRPKVVRIKRGSSGYDFVVKTVGKPLILRSTKCREYTKGLLAHYVENVERGGQAYKAGMRSGERIVEINRLNVEKESHTVVISRIKTSPDRRLELLVVDKATDELFLNQCITPSYKHLYTDIEVPQVIDKSHYDVPDNDVPDIDVTPPASVMYSPASGFTSSTLPRSPPDRPIIRPAYSTLSIDRSTPIRPAYSMMSVDRLGTMRSSSQLSPTSPALSVEDLTGRTEELIKELRLHNAEITRLKSNMTYSSSFVDPSTRDKYLNISSNDANSSPGSPSFSRSRIYRSTTSSSDEDHSFMTNNNDSPYKLSPEKPEEVHDLSDVAFNVDLKTLKEHSRKQREKNKASQREKPGFDNYWVAYRAVNNM